MFSRRFFKIISFVLNLAKRFDITFLRINKSTLLFYCDTSDSVKFKVYRNFILLILYFVGFCFKITAYHKQNNFDYFNLALPFLFGLLILITCFSTLAFSSNDLCTLYNGFTRLLGYLQSKFLYVIWFSKLKNIINVLTKLL